MGGATKKYFSDQSLIENIRNSNQAVFELVFKYYYSGLVVYADQILMNTSVSEDIVQSIFLKLWETRETIEIRSLHAYFTQCVKNRCIDYLRNQQVRQRFDNQTTHVDTVGFEDDLWTKTELKELIESAIEDLPPRCQEIFRMSRYDNLKISEIANKLNISKRTVETQISKALKIMRIRLIDYISLIIFYFFS